MITGIIPWMTDDSVQFIEKFIRSKSKNLNILEFGSGASTLYFSARCKSIVTFEQTKQYDFTGWCPPHKWITSIAVKK